MKKSFCMLLIVFSSSNLLAEVMPESLDDVTMNIIDNDQFLNIGFDNGSGIIERNDQSFETYMNDLSQNQALATDAPFSENEIGNGVSISRNDIDLIEVSASSFNGEIGNIESVGLEINIDKFQGGVAVDISDLINDSDNANFDISDAVGDIQEPPSFIQDLGIEFANTRVGE